MKIRLPNNWAPRDYQQAFWSYMENGGRHAELMWSRRAGKDEVCLHWTAVAAIMRPAGYWHMLPEAAQARKAIWNAVNPHTGKRRIDEAFPREIRASTNEQEMLIRFVNGSTWQVVGSDNYDSLVGAATAGIVYSEWPLAKPNARAYFRPIIRENNGWQVFVGTPRGNNHAVRTFNAALEDPSAFAQLLTVEDTGTVSKDDLEKELADYISEYGPDQGAAFFEQEYYCRFDAPVLGAYYGAEFKRVDNDKRITTVPHDPDLPVHTAWDLGFGDDTTIVFFQVLRGEIRVIDFHSCSGNTIIDIASAVHGRDLHVSNFDHNGVPTLVAMCERNEWSWRTQYQYGDHWLPHDAKPKTLAANGRSILQQLGSFFIRGKIAPNLDVGDGIKAVRSIFHRVWFDKERTTELVEFLRNYRRVWDDNRKMFVEKPLHDYTSHAADAFRMMAVAYRGQKPEDKPKAAVFPLQQKVNDLFWDGGDLGRVAQARRGRI